MHLVMFFCCAAFSYFLFVAGWFHVTTCQYSIVLHQDQGSIAKLLLCFIKDCTRKCSCVVLDRLVICSYHIVCVSCVFRDYKWKFCFSIFSTFLNRSWFLRSAWLLSITKEPNNSFMIELASCNPDFKSSKWNCKVHEYIRSETMILA